MKHLAEEPRGTEPRQVTWLLGLDGIRGVASLAVILAHTITFLVVADHVSPRPVAYAYVACTQALTMFFCLSGFLLYRPFAKAILADRPLPNLHDYYTGRVFRVYPTNVVILVVAGLVLGLTVTGLTPGSPLGVEIGRLTDPGMFLANLFLVQGYFPGYVLTGLDASWSLVVEITFYILLPGFALIGHALAKRIPHLWAAFAPGLLLVVIGAVCRQAGYAQLRGDDIDYGPTWSTVFQRSFLANCDLIGYGMVVAAVVTQLTLAGRDGSRLAKRTVRLSWIAIAFGVALSAVIAADPYLTPFFGLSCAGFLALVSMPRPTSFGLRMQQILEFRPFHYLGVISYSTYLWHFVVILFLATEFPDLRYASYGGLLVLWVLVSAISLTLGSICYHLVEAPAMQYARRRAVARRAAEAVKAPVS